MSEVSVEVCDWRISLRNVAAFMLLERRELLGEALVDDDVDICEKALVFAAAAIAAAFLSSFVKWSPNNDEIDVFSF